MVIRINPLQITNVLKSTKVLCKAYISPLYSFPSALFDFKTLIINNGLAPTRTCSFDSWSLSWLQNVDYQQRISANHRLFFWFFLQDHRTKLAPLWTLIDTICTFTNKVTKVTKGFLFRWILTLFSVAQVAFLFLFAHNLGRPSFVSFRPYFSSCEKRLAITIYIRLNFYNSNGHR